MKKVMVRTMLVLALAAMTCLDCRLRHPGIGTSCKCNNFC